MTVPSPEPPAQRPSGDGTRGPQRNGDQRPEDRERRRREQRRRLDEIFGDVLPATTDDERDPGERTGFDAEYYRRNRPPHHDR
jgi:hypothetical protein